MIHLTQSTKPISAKNIKRTWHLIDLKDQVVGRIAPKISSLLQGKEKADYAPYLDAGDFVVLINSAKVVFTGSKMKEKKYTRFSGYPGGLHIATAEELIVKNPNRIIEEAVSGMLPKNKLRAKRMARLFVFSDERHSYKSRFGTK